MGIVFPGIITVPVKWLGSVTALEADEVCPGVGVLGVEIRLEFEQI